MPLLAMNFLAVPRDQPPLSSGKVTSPRLFFHRFSPRQYGDPLLLPKLNFEPAALTQPELPSASMWTFAPPTATPSPSMLTPRAEYSQSTRCSPPSPGVATRVPTNHDSGTG